MSRSSYFQIGYTPVLYLILRSILAWIELLRKHDCSLSHTHTHPNSNINTSWHEGHWCHKTGSEISKRRKQTRRVLIKEETCLHLFISCILISFISVPLCVFARSSAVPCCSFMTVTDGPKSGWLTLGKPHLSPRGRNWPTELPGWRGTEKTATFLDSIVCWISFHPWWTYKAWEISFNQDGTHNHFNSFVSPRGNTSGDLLKNSFTDTCSHVGNTIIKKPKLGRIHT